MPLYRFCSSDEACLNNKVLHEAEIDDTNAWRLFRGWDLSELPLLTLWVWRPPVTVVFGTHHEGAWEILDKREMWIDPGC